MRTSGGTILGLEPKVLQVSPSTPIHSKKIKACNIHICWPHWMLRKYYWVCSTILLIRPLLYYIFFETNGITFHQLIARANVIIYGGYIACTSWLFSIHNIIWLKIVTYNQKYAKLAWMSWKKWTKWKKPNAYHNSSYSCAL